MPPERDRYAWRPLGDTAALVPGVMLRADAIDAAPQGIEDAVTAFGDTAVYFDPMRIEAEAAVAWANAAAASPSREVRSIELPVCYGGAHGPDLDAVASHAGLSADEVVQRHTAAEYAVGAVGFRPGFPYLLGLDPDLHTPRRADPRTAVPAGAVSIGGAYTGVYPDESPGGWNVIGRTPRRMHDPLRDPAAFVAVGDRVRFHPIDYAEFDQTIELVTPPSQEPIDGEPALRVVSTGVASSLQTLDRPGRRAQGVTAGGAMDPWSHRLANLLAGTSDDSATIEATLQGPVLEAILDVTLAVAGAVPGARRLRLARGERLDLRRLAGGLRAYVGAPGGFVGAPDRGLEVGDELHLGAARDLAAASWSVPGVALADPAVLRFVPGPDLAAFDGEPWERFLSDVHRVSPRSSRMGVRLETAIPAPRWPDDAPSRPVVRGAIQTPPDGRPIVLGADCQTIGGYPVIGCVASADWPILGQLRPGDRVRFEPIDLPAAIESLHQRRREFEHLRAGVAARDA